MSLFPLHTPDDAVSGARRVLEHGRKVFGFVPNLIAVMAETPPLAEAYLRLTELFAETPLTEQEQQLVLLAVSRANRCAYCVAAHTVLAELAGLDWQAILATRDDRPIAEPRLEALRRFATHLVKKRGWAAPEELEAFLAAGYRQDHVLAVVLGVGLKTLSNYTNHMAGTPLDAELGHRAWSPPAPAPEGHPKQPVPSGVARPGPGGATDSA